MAYSIVGSLLDYSAEYITAKRRSIQSEQKVAKLRSGCLHIGLVLFSSSLWRNNHYLDANVFC